MGQLLPQKSSPPQMDFYETILKQNKRDKERIEKAD